MSATSGVPHMKDALVDGAVIPSGIGVQEMPHMNVRVTIRKAGLLASLAIGGLALGSFHGLAYANQCQIELQATQLKKHLKSANPANPVSYELDLKVDIQSTSGQRQRNLPLASKRVVRNGPKSIVHSFVFDVSNKHLCREAVLMQFSGTCTSSHMSKSNAGINAGIRIDPISVLVPTSGKPTRELQHEFLACK